MDMHGVTLVYIYIERERERKREREREKRKSGLGGLGGVPLDRSRDSVSNYDV